MCCDICPKYDECEEKNKLKDRCCQQCADYDYCYGDNDHGDIEDGFDDDDKEFRNYY